MTIFGKKATQHIMKLSLVFLLASSSLHAEPSSVQVPAAHGWLSKKTMQEAAINSLLLFIMYSAYNFGTRKATNDAPDYDIEELLSGTDVVKNIKGLWFDGVWGHTGKNNALIIDDEGKIVVTDTVKVSPKGLVGNIMHNGKAIFGAFAFTWVCKIIAQSWLECSGMDDFGRTLRNKLNQYKNSLGLALIPNTLEALLKGNSYSSPDRKGR